MNDDLITDLWLKVMREAPISKIPELFAALVAEECAKMCDGENSFGYGYEAAECAKAIRAKFPLPPT